MYILLLCAVAAAFSETEHETAHTAVADAEGRVPTDALVAAAVVAAIAGFKLGRDLPSRAQMRSCYAWCCDPPNLHT